MSGALSGIYNYDPAGDWINADDVVSGLYAGMGRRFDMMDGLVAFASSIAGRMGADKSSGVLGNGGGSVQRAMIVQVLVNTLADMVLKRGKMGGFKHEASEALETAAVGKIGGQLYHALFGGLFGLAGKAGP